MKIVTVIPIARGIGKEELTYYSAKSIRKGSIVHVPLRKKKVPALVLSQTSVRKSKSDIRRSGFQLRKIFPSSPIEGLREEFIKAASEYAQYSLGTTGAVLRDLVPGVLFDEDVSKHKKMSAQSGGGEGYILQSEDTERYARYRGLIREYFARGASVMVILPSIADAMYALTELSKGISERAYVFHSRLTPKKKKECLQAMLSSDQPVLMVGTKQLLSCPRHDIALIIIDREHSGSHKSVVRPYIDTRTFVGFYAKHLNIRYILGDSVLRVESLYRARNHEFVEVIRPQMRIKQKVSIQLVLEDREKSKKSFSPLSKKLIDMIDNAIENEQKVFLLAGRRGLAQSTYCNDCGKLLLCSKCNSSLVLHARLKKNTYQCHSCGFTRSSETRCDHCDSWRLSAYGIGTDTIMRTVQKLFPAVSLFQIDSDHTKTHPQALRVAKAFNASISGILVGTTMALPYVRIAGGVHSSSVVSLDALFGIPDFRMNERIFKMVVDLGSLTSDTLILQTRAIEQTVLHYALEGNIIDFYHDELSSREQLGFPPFTIFIKLRYTKKVAPKIETMLSTLFAGQRLFYFDSVGDRNAIISLDEKWPQRAIQDKLRQLPQYMSINIEPEYMS